MSEIEAKRKLEEGCGRCIRIVEDTIYHCSIKELCAICKARINEREMARKEILDILDKYKEGWDTEKGNSDFSRLYREIKQSLEEKKA